MGTGDTARPDARPAAPDALARMLVLLAALFTILHLAQLIPPVWNPLREDEMTLLGAGARIARGEAIYREFHEFVPPAVPFWHALWIRIAGPRVMVARALMAAAWLALWAGLLAWRRRSGADPLTTALLALTPLWVFAVWPVSYHHWWGALLLVVWLAADARLDAAPLAHPLWRFTWGAALVLLPWTNQTSALACATALAVTLLVRWRRRNWPAGMQRALLWVLAVHVATFTLLAARGALAPLWADLVAWPAAHYGQPGGPNDTSLWADLARRLSAGWGYPLPRGWVLAACVAQLLTWPWALRRVVRAARRAPAAAGAGAAVVLSPLLIALGRADWTHVAFWIPVWIAVVLLHGQPDPGHGHRGGRLWAAVLLVCAASVPALQWRHPVPTADAWLHADALLQESGMMRDAFAAARANGGALPVVPRSGYLEFYGVPSSLDRSVLLPAAARYQDPAELQAAAQALAHGPAFVMVFTWKEGKLFFRPGDPVGEALRVHYAAYRRYPGDDGVLFRRKGVAVELPAQTEEAPQPPR